jgi:hypothetical protein
MGLATKEEHEAFEKQLILKRAQGLFDTMKEICQDNDKAYEASKSALDIISSINLPSNHVQWKWIGRMRGALDEVYENSKK